MNVKLDGDGVNVGDVLFDSVSGVTAKVVEVSQSNMALSEDGHVFAVGEDGYLNGVKRFWWHNPVLFIPKKRDAQKIVTLRAISKVIGSCRAEDK